MNLKSQTQPILVPPPPLPPGRVAAGSEEFSREPSRRVAAGFLSEMRRIEWPQHSEISAALVATVGVLAFFTLSIAGVSALVSGILRALGL